MAKSTLRERIFRIRKVQRLNFTSYGGSIQIGTWPLRHSHAGKKVLSWLAEIQNTSVELTTCAERTSQSSTGSRDPEVERCLTASSAAPIFPLRASMDSQRSPSA